MDEPLFGAAGAWGATKSSLGNFLAMGQTRLALLSNELEVGRITFMRQLLQAQALMFCAALAVVLTVALLVLLFWDQRLLVVGLSAFLFWALGAYFFLALRRVGKETEPLFGASLAELQEDLRQLKAASGHGPKTD